MGGDPIRSCLVCRRRAPQRTLVRLTVAEGALAVDHAARLGGRGAYICSQPPCIDQALRDSASRARRALRMDGGRTVVDVQAIRENWQAAARAANDASAAVAATGVCE